MTLVVELIGKGKDNDFFDMIKLQIFAKVLGEVSEETGIPQDVIASDYRGAEAVDARYLLVYFLHRRGFYASMIAPLIGHRKRSVNHIVSDFENRMNNSPMMRLYFERLHVRLGGAIRV